MSTCETGTVTRRNLLRSAGGLGVLAFGTSLVRGQAAFAAGSSTDTLLVLFLRGAADWLSLVPPVGDSNYATARPNIAVPASRAIALDSTFGLHPAMQPLMPFWNAGTLGFVHAAGSPDPTRSHFDAQASIEIGAYDGGATRTGWLDRYLTAVAPATSGDLFDAVAIGDAAPQSLAGPAAALSMQSLASFSLPPWPTYQTAVAAMHTGYTHPTATAGAEALQAFGTITAATASSGTPRNGATYPTSDFGTAMKDVATMIKASAGLRVATIDVPDWDMHQNLGPHGGVDLGWIHDRATDLAGGLAAFATDLGTTAMGNVTVVTLTDFGRRVGENGNGGVDHGHGQAMLLLGGGVRGGRVAGSWPTLAPAALDNGDLAGTTDLRSVLGEILHDRMGASDAAVRAAFPGWTPSYLDVLRPRS